MTELKDLMAHVNYFFEPINSTYDSDLKFEVYLTNTKWTITPKKGDLCDDIFGTTKYEHALDYLVKNNADLEQLHNLLFGKICTEGTHRRMQLRRVEKLVGKEAIDENEKEWENLTGQIKDVIDKEMKKKNGPKLEII